MLQKKTFYISIDGPWLLGARGPAAVVANRAQQFVVYKAL